MISCTGIVVVVAMGVATTAGLLRIHHDAGVLILWGVGTWTLWRKVRAQGTGPLPSPTESPCTSDKRAGRRTAHPGGVTIVYPSDITQQTGRTLPGPSTGDET